VASLTLSQTQIDLLFRDVSQLVVEARDEQGNVLSDRTATFSSSHTDVATVNEEGWVTGVGEGSATVTATLEGVEASASVTVSVLDFASVSTNSWHTCALMTDGSAYCWGYNIHGQLGIGTAEPSGCSTESEAFSCSTKPVAVSGGHTFEMVSTGRYHTCALTVDGDVYCWGDNEYGQLGNGTTVDSYTPVRIEAAVQFAMVASGSLHTCAVTVDDEAFCWGSNSNRKLGDGTNVQQRNAPVAVSGGLQFEWVSTGASSTCGIVAGGAAYCWGENGYGQLGNGSSTLVIASTPQAVSGDHTYRWISTDAYSTCALTLTGEAYCWGRNHVGQLGDGTTTQRTEPVLVSGGFTYESFSVGTWHTCGVTAQGMLYCWGSNRDGELGDGTGADKAVPSLVSDHLLMQLVAAGSQHTCALATTGRAYCWGLGFFGQLGHGSWTDALNPAPVIGSR
jgi:alpha-tubulin suppressor-like RCC1 family protein